MWIMENITVTDNISVYKYPDNISTPLIPIPNKNVLGI